MSAPLLTEVKNIRKIPFDVLEESLFYMAKRNQERIRSAISLELEWSSDVTEFVFNTCKHFKLEKSVKYVALEIYERFLAYHVLELRQSVKDRQETDRPLSWEVIEERITEQTVLRVLTSIQLASKLSSHYDHVLPTQVAEFLEKSGGKSYSKSGIFSSEIRVMKTLGFKLNVTTPELYVETLLCVLYTNDPSTDDLLYTSAVIVLDLVYLNRKKIYDHLFENVTGISIEEISENETFLKIKADYMLLGTAIITAAAYIVMREHWNIILEQLHQITKILRKDIKSFCLTIVDVLSNELDP
ncbi:cyclin N-terminal domain-containing protein 1 [Caerostris darwini]|uniref:Cyclin N-terminal domain-containing protein 1 n=1 Tax=Caerostris darwini TaxID=1538125 RepID=A0AAV4QQR6_9ARAC|nr:cyclin N-terminal domain-containing protein 1 [Caerostris darwini]